ncbi:uncharacterized protein LOC121914377 [Sceloporus undulatus]|uniref:uncharacterized protein LOC121914377 n=1 Tax=Sceloporus undulatus TaxID=8520 RepID=UPI001C4C7F10|nr:uncharacterized protein LOC121914377 [Sceloporus undulatus]
MGEPEGWGWGRLVLEASLATLLAGLVLAGLKGALGALRLWGARVPGVLVVGAGPVGLSAALVALASGKVREVTLLEERPREALLCRPQQVSLEPRSLRFLRRLGLDLRRLEGAWHQQRCFSTRLGALQEQLLRLLLRRSRKSQSSSSRLCLRLGTKFSEEFIKMNFTPNWPNIIIVADGSCGESSTILGISPEYTVESCNAYGANAVIERPDQRQVPTPEIRAHNLYFDLSAYGMDMSALRKESPAPGFHLKIYGTFRNRYLALACPASDSKIVRFLRHTLNSAIMKNIFHQAFNAYKMDIEPRVNELTLHRIQCSDRLFEIMLSHRRVTAALIEGSNTVVTIEGEAARVLNFDTGCGVNLGLRGLESTEELIYKVATAVDQHDIFEALAAKIRHSKQVTEDFKQNGLSAAMFE